MATSKKAATGLYDWRKGTLAGFQQMLTDKTNLRDQLNLEIDEMLALMTAMQGVKLKRKNTPSDGPSEGVDKAGRKKPTGAAAIPWQKRPGNEAKAAAWKRKMNKLQKERLAKKRGGK